MTHDELLAYYTKPGPFTELPVTGAQVDALPLDVGVLAKTVQNLLIHRFWAPAYRVETPPERENEQGAHSAEQTIAVAMRRRDAPIVEPRAAGDRAFGICRNFSVVMVGFLRRKGVPARTRCGFAAYFEPAKYVDHWVAEYWNADESRWVMVDAQIDELQRGVIKPDFDPLDVPRERFWVAGQAWQRVRRGEADGTQFGIADMWGDWYIVGNVGTDALALQNVEVLPWECPKLGEMGEPPSEEASVLTDRLAALTVAADARAIEELRSIGEADHRLRVSNDWMTEALTVDAAGSASGNPITGA